MIKYYCSIEYNLNKFQFYIKFIIIILFVIYPFNYRTKITKVGLCVIGKLENLYAKEYVNHYKNLGYSHIFIYDNNNKDDEQFEEVLKEEIDNGFVSIIDYRGFRGTKDSPQFDAYYDCYEKNSKFYNWISFFDFDEFLELIPNNLKINQFLDNERFSDCKCVKINWLLYSDNELISYKNIAIQNRFLTPLYNSSLNIHIKSTVRGKLTLNYWKNALNPHTTIYSYKSCSSSGKIIPHNSPFNFPPDYQNAILKHYKTKTIDEYLVKLKRGRADKPLNFTEEDIIEKINIFFSVNKFTFSKLKFIKKKLNLSKKLYNIIRKNKNQK